MEKGKRVDRSGHFNDEGAIMHELTPIPNS